MDAWTDAMLRGDFDAAWKVSDRVLARRMRDGQRAHNLPRHWQWLWDGRDLAGAHVLVHCYHGLGDTLQFVRLLPLLRERCKAVTLWLQPALIGLLRAIEGVDRIAPLHDGAPDMARDADVELMELPHILRLAPERIPARVPYPGLDFPRARRDPGEPLRVGLCWRSGEWNHARSIPEFALPPLAGAENVQWFSLQYPVRKPPFAMRELACRDLYELARRMCTLDLVISVDTLTAHLAGALGLPAWTLLPADCDWRWMRERLDSPWYPTMRLFRQARAGEWAGVVEEVAHALHTTAAALDSVCPGGSIAGGEGWGEGADAKSKRDAGAARPVQFGNTCRGAGTEPRPLTRPSRPSDATAERARAASSTRRFA